MSAHFTAFPPSSSSVLGHCYGLKYLGPHKIHTLRPNPQGDGIRRCGPREVLWAGERSLLDGTGALLRETPQNSPLPLCRVSLQGKAAVCEEGAGSGGASILNFSASGTVRQKYLSFVNRPVACSLQGPRQSKPALQVAGAELGFEDQP